MGNKSCLHDEALLKILDTNIRGVLLFDRTQCWLSHINTGEVTLSYLHGEQTTGSSIFGSVLDSLCLFLWLILICMLFPVINCSYKYHSFQGVLWIPSSKSKLRVILATPGICSSFQKWGWSWRWCPFVVGLTPHTALLNRIHLRKEVKEYYFIIYNYFKNIWGKERINVYVWW